METYWEKDIGAAAAVAAVVVVVAAAVEILNL